MIQDKISRKVFDALPEYSISNPTGVILGKVWKCNLNWAAGHKAEPDWVICEYVDSGKPGIAQVEQRKPVIIEEAKRREG